MNIDRKFGSARTVVLLTGTIIASGTIVPASGQSGPPPVRQAIDANGVDLMRRTFNTSSTDVSIGSDDQGMKFKRVWRGWEWRNNYVATINYVGGLYVISIGGASDSFSYSSPYYTSTEGNGSTLVDSGGDLVYTNSRGIVAVFSRHNNQYDVYGSNVGWIKHITFPSGDRWTYHYKAGQWCRLGYWNGTSCTVGLNTSLRVQSVTNLYGYQIKFEYATNSMTDYPSLAIWKRISKVTALNNAVEYCNPVADSCFLSNPWPYAQYNMSGTVETVVDQVGAIRTYTYNSSGQAIVGIRRATAATDSISIAYTSGKVSSLVKNHEGTAGAAYGYSETVNGNQRIVSFSGPYGNLGQARSHATEYAIWGTYDALGRYVGYARDSNWRINQITDDEGNKTQFVFDARGNVTETRRVAKPGSGLTDIVTTAGYDTSCTNPLICNKPLWTRDAKGNQTDYTYDPNHGGVLTVTLPAATPGGIRPQTRYTYQQYQAYYKNSAGSIVASGAPVYRLTGISTCQTMASCANMSDEVKSTIAYGPQVAGTANNLLPVAVTTGSGDSGLSAGASFTYDNVGNRLTVDGPLAGSGDSIRTRYDGRRRVVGEIGPDPDGVGARKPIAKRLTYNLDDRVTNTEIGNVNSQSEADWSTMTVAEKVATTYDANARPVKTELKSGATTYAVSQTSYDYMGRVDCTAQRLNPATYTSLPTTACTLGATGSFGQDRITKTNYNAASDITKVQTAVGTSNQVDEVTMGYTGNGKIDYVIDAENNRTEYAYDGHDRLVKTEYPSATKGANAVNPSDYEQFTFDANGNVTNRRLRDGTSIGYGYDSLNRLISKNLPGSEPDATYSYDLLGRAATSVQGGQTLSFTHDALGRNITQVGPHGTLTFGYDAAGRRTSMVYPGSALTVNYDYDVAGNVTKIRENGATSGVGVLATYAFDNLGRRTSVTFGNGSVQSFGYDPVSRLSTLTNNLGGSATTHDLTQAFTYNPASQIASVTRSNDAYAWQAHYNVDRAYVANGLNRIMSAGGVGFSYDARGNLTSDGTNSFTYTSENLLKTGPGSATLGYDPLGRLYQTVGGGVTTRFQYDGADLIAEYNGSNAVQRRYIHGPGVDNPIVWYEGSAISNATRRFLMADEKGSIVSVTDSGGATININAYDEYGIPAPGNVGRFGYTGQTWLPELGMWYYKARMYSPTLGRFMQADPIGYNDGMNWYNYVGSDPVNSRDPSGLAGDRQNPHVKPVDPKRDIVVTAPRGLGRPMTSLGTISITTGSAGGLLLGTEFTQTALAAAPQAATKHKGSTASATDFCGSNGSEWVPDGNWGEACAWHDACYAAQSGKEYCDAMLGVLMTGVISLKELGSPSTPLKPAVTGFIYSVGLIVSGLWEGGPSRTAYNRAGGN